MNELSNLKRPKKIEFRIFLLFFFGNTVFSQYFPK